ncbi:hypothetical protein [Cellulosilyticum sp. I15G10I2]|uniref:hypothetical protein n=1 Tax=Cellulosilyticum sp. I15G10I2 TaxID=1892843 RepID=UPI00085CCAD7|nr:hypothetical protein [Cellulosilyticum sp. I15G10I2]
MKKWILLVLTCILVLGQIIFIPPEIYAKDSIYDYDIIYSNFNIYKVYSGPSSKYTGFTIKKDIVITSITTYHYINEEKTPGQIALADEKGNVYGPWKAVGRTGQNGVKNAYWDVFPNITLKASDNTVYGVTVSDTSGWSYNSQSGGQGFIEIRGYEANSEKTVLTPTPTQTTPSTKNQSITLNQNIDIGKANVIGDLSKTQWSVAIPANTFAKNTQVKVNIPNNNSKYKSEGSHVLGSVVEITSGDGKPVRLKQPVTITMKLPADVKITDANMDDYVAAYWTGKGWDYIFPQIADLRKGIVKFSTSHFSTYGALKLTEQEKVKLYVQKMAVQQWADKNNRTLVMENIQDTFKIAFEKMGLSDATAQGELIRAVISENDFASLIVSAERGDVVSYTAKCGEMAANALIMKYKGGDKYLTNLAGKGAAAATGVGKALIKVYDGNYKGGAEELSLAFVNYFPAGRAFTATKEAISKGINTWRDSEIEYAYKSYNKMVGNGVYGFVSTDDWNTLLQQIGPALMRMQLEAKQAYAAQRGISINDVYKDKTLSAKIDQEVSANLKKTFDKRKANEVNIKNREAEYTKIVQGFMRDGLLTRMSFGFAVDMDIETRLRTLFAVRQNILGIFDGKMPVLSIGENAEQNLNQAIAEWIRLGPKQRDKFYDWLEQKGYLIKGQSGSNNNGEDSNNPDPFKGGSVIPQGADSPFNVIPGNGTKKSN